MRKAAVGYVSTQWPVCVSAGRIPNHEILFMIRALRKLRFLGSYTQNLGR